MSSFMPAGADVDGFTPCNGDQIARNSDVDFTVVCPHPDRFAGESVCTSSKLCYIEVLAHSTGKDLLLMCPDSSDNVPPNFLKDSALSAVAASPTGFVRNWSETDEAHVKLLTQTAKDCDRLGAPLSPIAFVFSHCGTRHAEPFSSDAIFEHYFAIAKRLNFCLHVPMPTAHADSLDPFFAEHPEVQVLILDEHFPLSAEQMRVINSWWNGPTRRAVVAFGSGNGLSADIACPGVQPCSQSYPGVLELIGLKQEDNPRLSLEEPLKLQTVSRVRKSMFLGDEPELEMREVANLRRVFGSRAHVLYDVEVDHERIPVVAEWRDRNTLALFCGFALNSETTAAAEAAVRYAMKETHCPPPVVTDCSEEFSGTRTQMATWWSPTSPMLKAPLLCTSAGRTCGTAAISGSWSLLITTSSSTPTLAGYTASSAGETSSWMLSAVRDCESL